MVAGHVARGCGRQRASSPAPSAGTGRGSQLDFGAALLADVDDAPDVDFSAEPDFLASEEPDFSEPEEPESEDPEEPSDPLDPEAVFDSDLSDVGGLAADLPRLSVR